MNRPSRNALFLLTGEVGSRLFGFLTSIYLARALGVDGFGQVGFALAVFGYATMATKLGLLTVGIRDTAQNHSRLPTLVDNIVTMRLLLGVVAAIAMVMAGFVLRREATVRGMFLLLAAGVVVQCLLLEWAFTGIERTGYISLARIGSSVVYFGLAAVLIRSPDHVIFVPVAFVAGTFVGMAVLVVAYLRRQRRLKFRLDAPVVRSLVKRAWPIGIASLLTQLHASAGIVVLSLMRGDTLAGEYTAAHRVVFFVLMLDRVFQAVFLPVVSRYLKECTERLRWLVGVALRLLLAIGLPVGVGLALLSSPAIELVFGSSYRAASGLLAALAWFVPLSLLTSLCGYSLLASGRERRFARNTLVGVGMSLCLIVLGVSRWGASGAALGMVLGEGILLLLMGGDFLRISPPKVDWRIAVPVIACVPLVVLLVALRTWSWPWAALAGAAVYLAVLFAGGGVTPSDLGLLRSNG